MKFINQAFDEQKYPGHADILQIRYSPQSPFATKLREIFKTSLDYLQKERTNTKGLIRVPEERREYLALYTTPLEDTFFFDHITSSEAAQIKDSISGINEGEFEYQSNYKAVDETARIEAKVNELSMHYNKHRTYDAESVLRMLGRFCLLPQPKKTTCFVANP